MVLWIPHYGEKLWSDGDLQSDSTHKAPGKEYPEKRALRDIPTGVGTTARSSVPKEHLSETNTATEGRACTEPSSYWRSGERPRCVTLGQESACTSSPVSVELQ